MSFQIKRRLFSTEDCYRMLDAHILSEGERVELIRGELLEMSASGPRHQAAVDGTTRVMVRLCDDKAIVRPQGPVELDPFCAPQPDIALLRPREDFYASKHPSAADILLIIEVADTSLEYDSTVKKELYAILRIPEYWIADLQNNRLIVHTEPQGDSYRVTREFRRGDIVAPQLLPECRMVVDVLLPR